MDAQKTHFADDETLKHIARLQALNAELVAALRVLVDRNVQYDASSAVLRFNELSDAIGAINSARAVLAKSKEAQS